MTRTATRLQLNFFPAKFSESQINLPVMEFNQWEESTEFLQTLPRDVRAHRENDQRSGKINVFVFNGEFDATAKKPVKLAECHYLPQKLIESAVSAYFRSRNYYVRQDSYQLRVLEAQPALQRGSAVVRRGISIRARRPFSETPNYYVISASWITPAEFTESLENETLRDMSLDGGVVFRPAQQDNLTRELRKFRNKYLGTVKEITSDTEVAVYCRDHSLRLFPTRQLYLEAKPSTLAEYDRRLGHTRAPIWSEMLKLNHTLTAAGRRNTSVLHDRLSSIQRVLANGNKRNLSLTATSFDEVGIEVDLVPVTVDIENDV